MSMKTFISAFIMVVMPTAILGHPVRPAVSPYLLCPQHDPIRYTGCYCDQNNRKLDCLGGAPVTQKGLDDILLDIYYLNNPTSDPEVLVEIPLLRLLDTQLTSLNLERFLGFRFGTLHISYNHNLTEVILPLPEVANSNSHLPLIEVRDLIFVNNNASDSDLSLANLFKLTANSLETVEIHRTEIDPGFLHEFSSLTYVHTLNLQGNNIMALPSGFISAASRLKVLGLDANQITVVNKDSLQLPQPQPHLVNETLLISLAGNRLTNDKFSPTSGLATMVRPTVVDLQSNNFVYISADRFETFLLANRDNTLILNNNSFICDLRMKWLKDNRENFESRVTGVDCSNDPGHTIFTTDLV